MTSSLCYLHFQNTESCLHNSPHSNPSNNSPLLSFLNWTWNPFRRSLWTHTYTHIRTVHILSGWLCFLTGPAGPAICGPPPTTVCICAMASPYAPTSKSSKQTSKSFPVHKTEFECLLPAHRRCSMCTTISCHVITPSHR